MRLPPAIPLETNRRRSAGWTVAGVFLAVLSVYVLSSPGRIDIIDGQLRYEVTENLIRLGRPILLDPALWRLALPGRYEYGYTHYGIAGPLLAVPLVWVSHHAPDPNGELSRFLFSLTSCILGALTGVMLYLFYLDLGVARRAALAWTLVSAFATLLWPTSTSTFDNAQHAWFALLAVYLGYRSATQQSPRLAAWAGFVAGILLLYQEYFIVLIPALALSTLVWPLGPREVAEGETARSWWKLSAAERTRKIVAELHSLVGNSQEGLQSRTRYLVFVGTAGTGLLLSLAYNWLRFGSIFKFGNFELHQKIGFPLYGDPLVGLLTLLVSPGKGILWYSPPIILGLLGLRQLWHRQPALSCTIVATSAVLLGFLSNIAFAGGDWCWGPRYLVPLLPLWALAFPFVPSEKFFRWLVRGVVGAGLVVQLLGLAVDHQRFFLERLLPDFFWASDAWHYFKHSALGARPREILSLKHGAPEDAQRFRPGPYPDSVTYCILGDAYRTGARRWLPKYKVFYLPRPWPLWMLFVLEGRRPINLELWITGWLGMLVLGIVCLRLGAHLTETGRRAEEAVPIVAIDSISQK